MGQLERSRRNPNTRGIDFDLYLEEEVRRILLVQCETGNFTRTGYDENGENKVHRFSFAVGTLSQIRLGEYRARFSVPAPKWVLHENPYHIVLLCKFALLHGLILPDEKPRSTWP